MSYELAKLHADIAQIQHDEAGFGTGRLVAKNLVLTAAHIMWKTNGGGPVTDGWQVRLAWDRNERGWRFRSGNKVAWYDDKRDLALIQILDFEGHPIFPKLDFRVADVSENNVHPVEARGYPRASKTAEQPRDLTPALGRLTAAAADRPFRFGVDSSDLPNDPHLGWPGMSGSAVLLQDWPTPSTIWVYGVVQSVPANFSGQLTVARLADAWRDSGFRRILVNGGAFDEDAKDPTTMSEYRFHRLVPEKHSNYKHSVLGMIISSTLNMVPVASLTDETLLAGHSLIELYKTVETLIELFQNLCDEIVEVLVAGGIRKGVHQSVYGSARKLGQARMFTANRKLANIALEMRDIASSIEEMLPKESKAREKLNGVLQLCASISVAEDFLVVEFGAPKIISAATDRPQFAPGFEPPGRIDGVGRHDTWDSSLQLSEYARVQTELDAYKRQLRREIVRVAKS